VDSDKHTSLLNNKYQLQKSFITHARDDSVAVSTTFFILEVNANSSKTLRNHD
jgi:hypothetical protein